MPCRHRSDADRADGNAAASRYDWKIIISKIVNIFARNHENGSGCFVYTMSQVQICACTRICTWRMYITWLLSEIVYKVYESSRSQPTRLSEEQNILQEKRKYAAYKSDLLFLKSIEMEKCMKWKTKIQKNTFKSTKITICHIYMQELVDEKSFFLYTYYL